MEEENQVSTSEKQDLTPIRNEKGQIISGTANPNGRPKGSRDFYTDFKEAIQRIKDKNSGESLTEQDIIKIGLEKMLKGDARFEGLYKDLMDRVYGKPLQKQELTGADGGVLNLGVVILPQKNGTENTLESSE